MLALILSIACLSQVHALSCPSYYDYSATTVTCRSTCPSSTFVYNNKQCLTPSQYVLQGQVHTCLMGWVNSKHTLCCPRSHYVLAYNETETCEQCHGYVYGNGRLCCPGSSYADFSTGEGSCTAMGKGQCPALRMQSLFRVCCPSGTYYHLEFETCMSSSGNNCDAVEKVCCRSGKKLQFLDKQFVCVSRCSWGDRDSFYCMKKFCSADKMLKRISPIDTIVSSQPLLAINNNCCFGMSDSGQCLMQSDSCEKRFMNRGWSICCQYGKFYNMLSRKCERSCSGYIILEILCIPTNSKIDFSTSGDGSPTLIYNSMCNSKKLPDSLPICCPTGFYINGTQGCKLCYGRLYNADLHQVCCQFHEIYNKDTQKCEKCATGNMDAEGTVCCFTHQYVKYNSYGVPECAEDCADEELVEGKFCCQSLTNYQCKITNYKPTACNPAYFHAIACQVCPSLCAVPASMGSHCTTSEAKILDCIDDCPPSTVYYSDLQVCLACDPSCRECSQPMESIYCLQCSTGYLKFGNRCERCEIECETCMGSPGNCTSCALTSFQPILQNNLCIEDCGSGKYWSQGQSRCMECATSCQQCFSGSANQCTKCHSSNYLTSIGQGSCQSCQSGCNICHSNKCYKCTSNLKMNAGFCTSSCPTGYITTYSVSVGNQICVECHPDCQSCSGVPQNCLSCKSPDYYLADRIGVSMCYRCVAPCISCTSDTVCSKCSAGYHLNLFQCTKCHETCRTCTGSSDSSCTACFGESQLISGKCVGCSSSCARCDINKNCLECKSPYLLYFGNCALNCPSKTYPVQVQCYDCLYNCSSCSNATSCVTCSATHPISFEGLCLTQCPSGYEKQNSACVKIIIPDPEPEPQPIPKPVDPDNETKPTPPTPPPTPPTPPPTPPIDPTDPIDPIEPVQPIDPDENFQVPTIEHQKVEIDNDKSLLIIKTVVRSLRSNLNEVSLAFYMVDKISLKRVKLNAKEKLSSKERRRIGQASNETSKELVYQSEIPGNIKLSDSTLQTSVLYRGSEVADSTYLSSKSFFSFILYDYKTNPLLGLQYVGLAFTILILIYSLISKNKGHFLAEESNNIIHHMLNFIQVVYLFKFVNVHTEGMYHFLNGFGFMHLLFFPNFFYGAIPEGYAEYPAEKSLIPDGNLIRNAGSSLSFLLIMILVMVIASIASYAIYRRYELDEMPQIRKIMRVTILLAQITFLNLLFSALVYLIQPHISDPSASNFQSSSFGLSILFTILIPAFSFFIALHFYQTYNSDVLEHFYTLRESAHYVMIIVQAFIFSFSIGKPLICLFLIPLEVAWLIFNIQLYRYGEGDNLKDHARLLVISISISIAYLFLALVEHVPWIAITVIVSVVIVVLIVYSSYQVCGMYYSVFQKKTE